MFEQAFQNIDNVLSTDALSITELDYIEQTSWRLFLKYLDVLETITKALLRDSWAICEHLKAT